jgi:hypothetical protein
MPQDLPSPELLRKLLRYEPKTGKLFWKARPIQMFKDLRACEAWNARYANNEAFVTDDGRGYKQGSLFDKKYRAHRVVWALVYNSWPDEEIDHVDGNGLNNRMSNLRLATRFQNCQNAKIRINNVSGLKGVSKNRSKWRARIKVNGVLHRLGNYETAHEAHEAYVKASLNFHGAFSHFASDPAEVAAIIKKAGEDRG